MFRFVAIQVKDDGTVAAAGDSDGGGDTPATMPPIPRDQQTDAGVGVKVAISPSASGGLTIHIRTKIETWWSFIEAAVIQVGDQMLEVRGREEGEEARYWVNGLEGDENVANDTNLAVMQDALANNLKGFKIIHKKVSKKQQAFRINLNNQGDSVSIRTFKDWVSVNLHVNPKAHNFDGVSGGMMGAYPSGAMLMRNGATIASDPNEFGNEWQVRADEPMLFHDRAGPQHLEKCIMPTAEKTSEERQRGRLGETLITEDDAELACARVSPNSFKQCVFDVLATNDKDMAGAY
ncbi:expressed unknown protein [Seminavis robusta]|uniref:VWFD domain-containing protein n=1 Tax=Seminavis robusta TaxID=568900 RepID=A0A9N8EL37_9STRA|nr:expressed unknown protein [Seminavis robusta]|eukprot:Sro1143_g245900.1 n/a (292) ;mRNA; f:2321-3634